MLLKVKFENQITTYKYKTSLKDTITAIAEYVKEEEALAVSTKKKRTKRGRGNSWTVGKKRTNGKTSTVAKSSFKLANTLNVVELEYPDRKSSFEVKVFDKKTKYAYDSQLGQGSFGSVVCATTPASLFHASNTRKNTLMEYDSEHFNVSNKDKCKVAVKNIDAEGRMKNCEREVFFSHPEVEFIMSVIPHPTLLRVYDMFVDNRLHEINIVTEAMQCNLLDEIDARSTASRRTVDKREYFSQETIKSIFKQILQSLNHIHKQGFFHRDLKPENILLSTSESYYSSSYLNTNKRLQRQEYVVKLCDYGLTTRLLAPEEGFETNIGTLQFNAPEMALDDKYYDGAVDVWSFGCLAYEMVAHGGVLFHGFSKKQYFKELVELLGTPCEDNELGEQYEAKYGYSLRMKRLLEKKDVDFKGKKCVDIREKLKSIEDLEQFEWLFEIIEKCLQWKPSDRPTVAQLLKEKCFR